MLPAPEPSPREAPRADGARVLLVPSMRVEPLHALPAHLGPGDVLVLNDAATFPGSVHFTRRGLQLELRLYEKTDAGFRGILFGPGDFHTRTEDRPPPPRLAPGEQLSLAGLTATVISVDIHAPRRLELAFEASEAQLWHALYAHGAPIQYAHQPAPLPLWAVQNAWAERPWAAELPSAGHHFTLGLLRRLERAGVQLARLTHATGLSATGDATLDAALPWPERYELPARTVALVRGARRVIALGTSVLRALEAWAHTGQPAGVATGAIEPSTRLRVTQGLLTGIHSPQESHWRLLGSLASADTLRAMARVARDAHLAPHEFGDLAFLLRS